MIKKIALFISLYFLYSTFTFAANCLGTFAMPPNLGCGSGYTLCDAGNVILGTELPSQFGGQSFPSGISTLYAPYTNASGQYWECYDCNWAVECSLPFSGDVNVTANIPSASWTITSPSVIVGSGTSQNTPASPAGTYTITWGAVSGYTKPASQTFTLVDLGTITFVGTYTACTWGWGIGKLTAVPNGTNSSAGCSGSTVNPTYACNASRSAQVLTCVDFIPDAFNYTCACRVGAPAPTVNLWFSP